ncbi:MULTISPECIES: Gfo/Idh/MocA family protein [Rhizobium/Agrobacterium group]|uniref:Gfo/Idh/MocA family protein n=1 Tax=Rhizobium/Agrobacterium group TaxID=227290 RepID=UPI0023000154|nr:MULTISPECIES: Gfo/Idh/MocA family oxidoreductase [Rhizobium/Agrobacterium group]MDA5636335.1 Gfo/Idh/MocA family oxidoreductase [Agrobacterium sp. ST15.16.024]MDF1892119.1 Gfo/Idh/MocA family oxidoreductase [Rhizobium rhizogenes]
MKIAVAGLGFRLANVIASFRKACPELEIVGLMDPRPAGLPEILSSGLPEPRRFETVETMLTQTRPDLLMVGSPNFLHLDHITAGLRAGVRVFTEKPVVIDEDQTMRMARLLAEYGSDSVMVGLVLRYSDLYRDLHAAQAEGHIGAITSIEASEHIAPYHGAFFMRDWRRHTRYAGPFILEKCCHDIDLYGSVVGQRAMAVASFGGRKSFVAENRPDRLSEFQKQEFYKKPSGWLQGDTVFESDGDIIDYQTAIIEYQGGATMSFHTNLNVPDQFRRFCVIGSKGMAEGDFIRNRFEVHSAVTGEKLIERRYEGHESDHYGADDQMASDIYLHLTKGAPLSVGIVAALEAGLVAIKIDEARRARRTIELVETWQRFDDALLTKHTAALGQRG